MADEERVVSGLPCEMECAADIAVTGNRRLRTSGESRPGCDEEKPLICCLGSSRSVDSFEHSLTRVTDRLWTERFHEARVAIAMKSLPFLLSILFLGLAVHADEPRPIEFDTGRPRPPKAGFPVMGSGLAMSGGCYRGVPMGELSGWTMSLWFQPRSGDKGEIFNAVLNEKQGAAIRLVYEAGVLRWEVPGKNPKRPGRAIVCKGKAQPERWHHVAIAYQQATGSTIYLNGRHVGQGQRNGLGYATSFDHYQFGAGIREGGALGGYFDGLIDDFLLFDRPMDEDEMVQLFEGGDVPESPVAFNDFENVNHQDLAVFSASDRDEKYLDEGRELYEINCGQCHSKDGITPPLNPLSRAFTKHRMENGGDPFSMFQTVTYGFRNMMPAVQLIPEDRYKVIHFIREKLVLERAPELYVEVNEGYTDAMPRSPEGSGEEVARQQALAKTGYLRDYGKALISPVKGRSPMNESPNALSINLGSETTLSYDLGTMRSIGAWRGGFLDFENTLHHKLRAPGLPSAASFDLSPGSDQWRWAWDGKADKEVPDIGPHTVWPEQQIRYRGHYPFGNEIVISYAVQGRGVLESPVLDEVDGQPVIHRRLSIEPGDRALEVVVLGESAERPVIEGSTAQVGDQFAFLQSTGASPAWRVGQGGELVLRIPASGEPIHVDVALATDGVSPSNRTEDLTQRTRGGPARWPTIHTMKGRLGVSSFQSYMLDSLPVPLKNAYNTWMRTSCLAFFPDGRLAVGTLSGDVWIVSGIDQTLEAVTWKRFAAGLYEPMGMKVVDGVLTVGTRGRIVRLHDVNEDGEADFYEAFFNEPEPAPGWHAYSFDLEVGDDGSYYYARVGGFSEWSIPGGMVRVAPNGESWEVLGAGMRVPNGIGLLPDGRVTFSDNQGTFVPASKISITRTGDFHGAGKWPDRDGDWDPEAIVPPLLYMPQELDSSSGSQLWVEKDERLGPLSGSYFHTSYGRARIIRLMLDEVEGGLTQAAAFPLPLTMESGTMRMAKNPIDGHLYTSGLTGWQAGATREGAIQRLRFSDVPGIHLIDAKAREGRLELSFDQPIDPASIEELEDWGVEAWNYRWSKNYGSPHFKVSEPGVEGADVLEIDEVRILDGGRRLAVSLPELEPCHTLQLTFQIGGVGGLELDGEVYFTIHELPE